MLFFVVIIFYFSYLRKIIKINNGATEGLVQQLLQRIWAIGSMGSWFCTWKFSDNRKINHTLETKPALVPERYV
jgi:hypothetical protein